ncbi:hypothetical protein PT974_02956 [Cladobotryum mycophilum]|uniref:YMC020W-like alpha/beta hydrolase domain-containing protein n=1 Tax=Cladobotryum mycophilum TaxID=491253 RepID=A0ABR0SZQ2_9HYPO
MLPRKRHRPNPAAASSHSLPTTALSPETSLSRASSTSDQAASHQRTPQPKPANGESRTPTLPHKKKLVHKTQSWYGSWPRTPKASPSTSIARENISVATIKPEGSPDLSRFEPPSRNDDAASIHSMTRNSSAPPKVTESTVNGLGITIDKRMDEDKASQGETTQVPTESTSATQTQSNSESQPAPEPDKADENANTEPSTEQAAQQEPASSGWLSWWSKSTPTIPPDAPIPDPNSEPVPEPPNQDEVKQGEEAKKAEENESVPSQQNASTESTLDDSTPDPPPAAGWFSYLPSVPGFGSKPVPVEENDSAAEQPPAKAQDAAKESSPAKKPSAINEQTSIKEPDSETSKPIKQLPPTKDAKVDTKVDKKPDDAVTKDTPAPGTPGIASPPPKAGSTWAFWSKETPKTKGKTTEAESGEIAVIGESSEAQPAPIAENDVAGTPTKDNKSDAEVKDVQPAKSMWRRSKRHRPLSVDIDSSRPSSSDSMKPIITDQNPAAAPQVAEQVSTPTRADSTKKAAAISEALAKQKPNLLLPSFSSTYQMKENPSILKQITSLVLRSSQSPPNHVFRVKDPPKSAKPSQSPTGTSLRFANLAADAIRRWTDNHGSPNCEIEKVALEGEGRINERVDSLWKLMLNWVEQIRQADLIIMACHSQGVPVGIMLLQKLIDLGIVTHARIGVCAMAGVALGPFPDYKSSILMGSAAELWEFGNPQSNNSRRFELCLKRVLDYGARITFIGSIDDQLVPMESAVYSPANHPYIYRAVFIDGRIHAPDFIAHLVGFALKLRNLGVSDHGLIRELSVALAGSLYSGEGHSRLYYDDAVYDLTIMHALETTNTTQPTPCDIPKRDAVSLASSNPYVLPWIMRGLLEENFVKTQLSTETEELLQQFDDWKPTNKALKDVKYRLEAVRSKL